MNIGKGLEDGDTHVIAVKKNKKNDDILAEEDENEAVKPFNWNIVFKLAIKEYAEELE